ncbi:hypothetical protein PENTCL1PPCAC_19893, partial [Pristionchus entomophagus]
APAIASLPHRRFQADNRLGTKAAKPIIIRTPALSPPVIPSPSSIPRRSVFMEWSQWRLNRIR